jgi:hypothetical protein
MIRPEPIEGFDAIKFKDEMQERVQAELEGLTGEERLRKMREMLESGPLAEWWAKMRAQQELRRAS